MAIESERYLQRRRGGRRRSPRNSRCPCPWTRSTPWWWRGGRRRSRIPWRGARARPAPAEASAPPPPPREAPPTTARASSSRQRTRWARGGAPRRRGRTCSRPRTCTGRWSRTSRTPSSCRTASPAARTRTRRDPAPPPSPAVAASSPAAPATARSRPPNPAAVPPPTPSHPSPPSIPIQTLARSTTSSRSAAANQVKREQHKREWWIYSERLSEAKNGSIWGRRLRRNRDRVRKPSSRSIDRSIHRLRFGTIWGRIHTLQCSTQCRCNKRLPPLLLLVLSSLVDRVGNVTLASASAARRAGLALSRALGPPPASWAAATWA